MGAVLCPQSQEVNKEDMRRPQEVLSVRDKELAGDSASWGRGISSWDHRRAVVL